MKKIFFSTLFFAVHYLGNAQSSQSLIIPAVPNPSERLVNLKNQWDAFQKNPPLIGVRSCFTFLLDALDTRFLKDEQVVAVLKKVQTRMIDDPTAGKSYGNIFWGWNETGNDIGDGNNVEFCMQYAILIKILFNDRLSAEANKTLSQIFSLGIKGARNQFVRVSYTNIYLMKIWNLVSVGQVYHQPAVLEEGRQCFNTWLNQIARNGNREYDSPTYAGVAIESLLLLHKYINDADIKKKASVALDFLLTDLCSHYNPRAGILAGAHSRDYNRVFSRDLLENYFNPLLGGKDNNNELFRQVCYSALREFGLTPFQKGLMKRNNRFIVQRWDSLDYSYSCDFVGKKVSIASSNQAYSPDDKSFAIYLSSPTIPEMPNITYVMEGRDDPYGTWGAEGKGAKLKYLMPANYPANGGWAKTRHLMPFIQVAQNKGEFVMLVDGKKDHNCIKDYLNSTVILPNYFDEIWLGNKKIVVPNIGDKIAFDSTNTFIARFEDVGVAFRILWDNADKTEPAYLFNDGFQYLSTRSPFLIKQNKAIRFTLKHPNNGNGRIAMWWKTTEGIKTAADFLKFKESILKAAVVVKEQNGIVDISVNTVAGKLGVKADLIHEQRLHYYNPTMLPNHFLFNVDGVEIGKPIIEKYRQKQVLLDNYFNNEVHSKTGLPFHYLWTDTAMSGFSQLGEIFKTKGADIQTLKSSPTAKNLKDASVYIIVDADTKEESKNPNFMTLNAADEIAKWVNKGGVLMIMANDFKNAELDSFNILAGKFGMQFNKDQIHPVTNRNWNMGASTNLPEIPLFTNVHKIYLKEVASIVCRGKSFPVFTEQNKVLMAACTYGKGYVFAIGDPWIYNEYIGHWMLPADFDNTQAANNLVEILLKKSANRNIE